MVCYGISGVINFDFLLIETVSGFSLSLELAQGLDTDKINPYIEKCFGIKKDLLTVRK